MCTYAQINTTDKSTRHYNEIIEKLDDITQKHYPDNEIILKQ